jgi:hypothetical protein
LQADIPHIIIESRNKEYGAYNAKNTIQQRGYERSVGSACNRIILFILNQIGFHPMQKTNKLITDLPDVVLKTVKVEERQFSKTTVSQSPIRR